MATYHDNSDTTNHEDDTAVVGQFDYLDQFDEIPMNLKSNDHDKTEFEEDMDLDNVYSMEREAHDYTTDQFDHLSKTDDDGNNDGDATDTSIILKPIEEHILSEKFSQCSTVIINEKPMTVTDIRNEIEKIPHYLIKRNQLFKQMIREMLPTMALPASNKSSDRMEELRKITLLIYKVMVIQCYRNLWTNYSKSGKGQLITHTNEQPLNYPVNLPIWPKEIKAMLPKTTASKMNEVNENEICMKFVDDVLHELDHHTKKYQMELEKSQISFIGYTATIQQGLETYVTNNLQSLRLKIEHQIELLHLDYHIRAIKLEYLRHNPTSEQKELMKQLCKEKYEQEITDQEEKLLHQRITYYNSTSQSFESSTMTDLPWLHPIENATMRQQLLNQYQGIIEQSKSQLLALYIKSAKEERIVCKNQYQASIDKMGADYRSSTVDSKMPMIMLDLIEQRCRKISERIQCTYKIKAQSLLSN